MSDFSQAYTALYNYTGNLDARLNFNIGGLIQYGAGKNKKNQDAMAIAVNKDYIAGVICDGCAGTVNAKYNISSFNEFGAAAIASILLNAVRSRINSALSPNDLLLKIDRYLYSHMQNILKELLPEYYYLQRGDIEHYIYNMLCATIVGLIVTPEYYVIFNYGDGIFAVNNNIANLDAFETKYYAKELFSKRPNGFFYREHCFNICAQGRTCGLENALIGSDGMIDFIEDDIKNNELVKFLKLDKENFSYKQGLSTSIMDFPREFRVRAAMPFERRRDMFNHDDRSVIVLRRLDA